MIAHQAPISGIATCKGKYVATGGYDNKVILWNAQNKCALSVGFHDHLVNQCEFSLDGKYLASTSSDYTTRIWSVPDMKLHSVLTNHEDDAEGLAFHPTLAIVATSSRDARVRIFQYSGELIATYTGHMADVLSVSWLNNDYLLSSSDDGTVKIWSFQNRKLVRSMDIGDAETDSVVAGKKGSFFAGNDLGEIIFFNDSKRVKISAHGVGIKKLCYCSRQNLLVSISYDGILRIWQVTNQEKLILSKTFCYPNIVWARACAFIDDTHLAFASFGSSYTVLDYKKGKWDLSFCENTRGINAMTRVNNDLFSVGDSGVVYKNNHEFATLPSLCNFIVYSKHMLISGAHSGEIFDVYRKKCIYKHPSPLNCGKIFTSNNKEYLIVGSYTGICVIFKIDKYTVTHVETLNCHKNAIKGIAIGDMTIFSIDASGIASMHSREDYTLIKKIISPHKKIANACVHIGRDIFMSVGRDLMLRISSISNQKNIRSPHKHSIKCLGISKDGRYIATGDYRGYVGIYILYENKWRLFRPTYSGISSVIYDHTTTHFLASSYDGNIYRVLCSPQSPY